MIRDAYPEYSCPACKKELTFDYDPDDDKPETVICPYCQAVLEWDYDEFYDSELGDATWEYWLQLKK